MYEHQVSKKLEPPREARSPELREGFKQTMKNNQEFFEPQFSQQQIIIKWLSCSVRLKIKIIYVKYLIMCQVQCWQLLEDKLLF